ncbi:MAG: phosphotransferase [Lentisphaerae bacterium]|jgi:fructosamine-3-kinase|nr:phosphotransferase [Lentisphaerota bacterium]MBT4823282.1 phosphotransferase [Lentisphaerota bacterium]MBT5610847.1 phosphotransferase [Lentisphaerota bacterium]MBT7053721.1 phosphotransferase [Lentisphaerota bacterium]MBT7841182.1 phosphotransferase [Lentisphaerota bacterium]
MELSTNLDVSRHQVETLLARWLGKSVSCTAVVRLTGGMVNSVLRATFENPPYQVVVKLGGGQTDGFQDERLRLDYLRSHSIMRCPEVYGINTPDDAVPHHSLLLECLPGIPLTAAELGVAARRSIDEQLVETLLGLHSNHRALYGAVHDDGETDRWADIEIPRMLDMREEMVGRLDGCVVETIDTALGAAPEVFHDQGPPTLIHGDLWAGNILVRETGGKWTVTGFIDPGVQYADVEHELAYLECFQTVGPAFMPLYRAVCPARPGYPLRRLYYWLNTMMIHVWLFGDGHYCRRTAGIAAEIVDAVG